MRTRALPGTTIITRVPLTLMPIMLVLRIPNHTILATGMATQAHTLGWEGSLAEVEIPADPLVAAGIQAGQAEDSDGRKPYPRP
jgi:hypothetical protein